MQIETHGSSTYVLMDTEEATAFDSSNYDYGDCMGQDNSVANYYGFDVCFVFHEIVVKMYKITFFNKWEQSVFFETNTCANSADDAYNSIVQADIDSDDYLGLECLEYSIVEL